MVYYNYPLEVNMSSNKTSIFVITITILLFFSSSSFSYDGMAVKWWGTSDYAEDYINSLGDNSYIDNLLKIGTHYYKNGDYDLAIKNLRSAIDTFDDIQVELHPKLSAAYLILGKIYHKMGRYNDAVYALTKAYYSYGYLYNLEAYNLLKIVKAEIKNNKVDKLFERAKVPPKPVEEVEPEIQQEEIAEEIEKFEFDFPPELFEMAHFDFDSSELTQCGRKILDFVAQKLDENPKIKILIDGYCDSKGSEEYNMKLGLRRANSAKTYLTKVHNINPDKLLTRSYGEKAPIDTNETDSGRAKNRRIQFTVQLP